jgi:hypothetical protein
MKRKLKQTEWKCRFEDIPPDCYEDVLVWDCSWKGLTSLPPAIGRLTNLQKLICTGNDLTSLPPKIGRLTSLRVLNCSWNGLTSLPSEIGHLTNLQVLICWENQLTSLPSEIGCLTNLQELYCWGNQLTSLPPEIGRLINLQVLSYWGNQLSSKTREAVEKIIRRNKERDVLVLILLHDFFGNTFPFQLCDQILLHCRVQWFCDDMGLQ